MINVYQKAALIFRVQTIKSVVQTDDAIPLTVMVRHVVHSNFASMTSVRTGSVLGCNARMVNNVPGDSAIPMTAPKLADQDRFA